MKNAHKENITMSVFLTNAQTGTLALQIDNVLGNEDMALNTKNYKLDLQTEATPMGFFQ